MSLVRLHPNVPESWALWPVFEARCVDFMRRVAQEPVNDQFVAWLRESFVKRPEIFGAWLSLEDTHVVGHLLAWVDAFFGDPYVFIHQVEAEPGATVEAVQDAMIDELRHWVDEMNWVYERTSQPTRIHTVRFTTMRSPRAWSRYLDRLGTIEKTRTVITLRVHMPGTLVLPPAGATINGDGRA